jgi:hypothetical protein
MRLSHCITAVKSKETQKYVKQNKNNMFCTQVNWSKIWSQDGGKEGDEAELLGRDHRLNGRGQGGRGWNSRRLARGEPSAEDRAALTVGLPSPYSLASSSSSSSLTSAQLSTVPSSSSADELESTTGADSNSYSGLNIKVGGNHRMLVDHSNKIRTSSSYNVKKELVPGRI